MLEKILSMKVINLIKNAIIRGYGLRIGVSELDFGLYSYGDGCKNILYDKEDEFDKWSRCYQIPKPKSTDEFPKILETLIKHSQQHEEVYNQETTQ